MTLPKPRLIPVPLADGLRWRGGGFLFQEKADGVWQAGGLAWNGHLLNAEAMPGGDWVVNDLMTLAGRDVRGAPLAARWPALVELSRTFPGWLRLCAIGAGGEFLEAVLAAGGEGVVAKRLDSPFGVGWWKSKRQETHDCTVAEKHEARAAVRLNLDGQDAGWLACRGVFERIRIGDVVEVAAQGRHASGKLREARFIRMRPDKPSSFRQA